MRTLLVLFSPKSIFPLRTRKSNLKRLLLLQIVKISPYIGLQDFQTVEYGKLVGSMSNEKDRSIRARANLSAEDVYANNLKVVADPLPHDLHANIRPFPADKRARDRIAKQRVIALRNLRLPANS